MKSMKLFFGAAIALCLFTFLGCPSPTPTPVSSSDIIARYPFDGNLLDSSGHHHNATASGPVRYGLGRFGKHGRALILNGRTSLTAADSSDLHFKDTASFSIYSWIKTTDTADAGIVCKGPSNNSVPGYRLELKGGKPHVAITAVGSNVDLIAPKPITDNHWHLLTMTVTPDAVNLYVDTNLVAQKLGAKLRADSSNAGPLTIGAMPGGGHQYRGYMDQPTLQQMAISKHDIIIKWEDGGGIVVGNITMPDLPPGMIDLSGGSTLLGMAWLSDSIGVACGTTGLLQRTVNAGATWSIVTTSIFQQHLFAIAGMGSNCVSVGYGSSYCISADKGVTWAANQLSLSTIGSELGMTSLSDPNDVHLYAIRYLSPTKIIATGAVRSTHIWLGIVLMSTDAGGTWHAQPFNGSSSLGSGPIYCIAGISTGSHPYCIVAGTGGQMYKLTSASSGWTTTAGWSTLSPNVGDNITGIDFESNGHGVAVTNSGLIYEFNGSSWTNTWNSTDPGNPGGGLYTASVASPGVYVVAGDAGVIMYKGSSGWLPVSSLTGSTPLNPDVVYLWSCLRPNGQVAALGFQNQPGISSYWWVQP